MKINSILKFTCTCVLLLGLAPISVLAMEDPANLRKKRSREEIEAPLIAPQAQAANPVTPCQLFATPNDNIIGDMAMDIKEVGAKGYIGLESPYLSNSVILGEICIAANRGAKVRIFTDQKSKIPTEICGSNVQVTQLPNLHAKRLVINTGSQKIVWIGSMNMSEHSRENHEIMMRCTDQESFKESFGDQQRIGQKFYQRATQPVDFKTRRIINSSTPEAQAAKIKVIEEFSRCSHPHDYLYFVTYTLEDPEIVQALLNAKQRTDKPISCLLDRKSWKNIHIRNDALMPLVNAGIKVYIFNKNEDKVTSFCDNMSRPIKKDMHIKAILRKCDQECLSCISTANFTPRGKEEINHDIWEPCSLAFSSQFKKIIDSMINESTLLNTHDFPTIQTREQITKRLLELMRYPNRIFPNMDEIFELIRQGADPNAQENNHAPLLINAINSNQPKIVQALIDAGANVNFANEYKQTALHLAARSGFNDIIRQLLEAGAEIDFTDKDGNSALFMTISGNLIETAKILIELGADINLGGDYRVYGLRNEFRGTVPPIVMATKLNKPEMVQLLIDKGAQIDAVDPEGLTALWHAVKSKNLPLLSLLIKARANLNSIHPQSGMTPLILATLSNNYDLVKTLLSAGADLNARDYMGKMAINYATDARIRALLEDVAAARKYNEL